MGSAHDIMHTFALRDLQAHFPDYDGWKLTTVPAATSGTLIHRVSRYSHHRKQEAIISVSFDAQPSERSVFALLSIDANNRTDRCLLVPQGADVSGVPSDVRIFIMTAYGFSHGNLVWLTNKKNAMWYSGKESAPSTAPIMCG